MYSRRKVTKYRTRPLSAKLLGELNSTQGKVRGFDLARLQEAQLWLIGAGGIGSPVGATLVRKGVGKLTIFDPDVVELSNCTRQLYGREDVGHFKSERLARRLSRAGMFATELVSVPMTFQEAEGFNFGKASVIVAGVDNNPSRKDACRYGLEHGVPVIHAAVSRAGGELYVMVQEPGRACFGCAFPHSVNDDRYPCNLPGIADVLQVCCGLIVYAIDSVLCGRAREWNLREVFLDGSLADRTRNVERRPDCALCGSDVEAA